MLKPHESASLTCVKTLVSFISQNNEREIKRYVSILSLSLFVKTYISLLIFLIHKFIKNTLKSRNKVSQLKTFQ